MANDTILTPGGEHWEEPTTPITGGPYLERDKYLGEYEDEAEKSLIRDNINVYSKDQVYTQQEAKIKIDETLKKAFEKYLTEEDPHGILPKVSLLIKDAVKTDGSTPFTEPQKGVDPIEDFHLATQRFVKKILKDHINSDDPHRILPDVEDMLKQYVKQSQVYFKDRLYTKDEINNQASQYIRKDGTTPFTKAQLGADPQIDGHLTTKRYVDKVIYEHLVSIDPHGFIELLNNRLANYAKVANVYDKTQTYSRIQIDSIIKSLVQDAANSALRDHLHQFDPHHILDKVKKEKYVKQDGSVPFRSPQKGQDAIDPKDLVTLRQLQKAINEMSDEIKSTPPVWITSGPVESSVGHVEDKSPVPPTMTFQEIMDAIFYGKSISLDAPDYVMIGHTCEVTMCIHGSLALVEYAELWQGDQLLGTYPASMFEGGCLTVDSLPIYEDTEFTFKVFYTNGTVYEESKLVKCSMPVFVGLLPKWKPGYTITFDYLKELETEDTEGTQNRFLDYGDNVKSISFKYRFKDVKLRHPFIVVPADYPNLSSMVTKSQSFGLEAFDVIDMIPFQIPGVEKDIIFKIYIYRQALSSLNQKVTFKFEAKE